METETLENSYKIKTGVFEGPFGLLLNLVEKRKLFINDLSLAQVTEDYLNYVNQLGSDTSKYASEISSFVVVAATLILIKSKSLLPNLDLTNEEESDISRLEERLRLYKIFTELGVKIKDVFGEKIIFAPQDRKIDTLVFLPDERITKDSMMTFARDVLNALPKKVNLPKVDVKKVISIEEMIDKLADRIQTSIKMSFREFTGGGKSATKEEKITVIVGFLAMLEMVRNGILHAVQENNTDDIIIEKRKESVGEELAAENI
ncbi:MAG: segregation/condensation protein A [Candidatus Pacebacteria bacterium]|nr:segregation/condensation protein A [Candidatus Paceibacterota bacterium]